MKKIQRERTMLPRAVRVRRNRIKRALVKAGVIVAGITVLIAVCAEAHNRYIDVPKARSKYGVTDPKIRFRNDISTTEGKYNSPTNIGRGHEVDYSSANIYRKDFYDMGGKLRFEGLGSNSTRYFRYEENGIVYVTKTEKQGSGWTHVQTYSGEKAEEKWAEARLAYGS